MSPNSNLVERPSAPELPFPADWITGNPREVEKLLSRMSVAEQARCIMLYRGKEQQDLLLLSNHAVQVTHALPPEEIYHMIKVIGREEALPVLSLASEDQLQFMFDMEWWSGDRFQPQRALEWLSLLDKCEEPKALEWFLTEEFDQKVMLMQAFIKVFKRDEMTDSYEGTEELVHFTPDGVYDIFFKIQDYDAVKKLLMLLRSEQPEVFFSLMEAVIWYPLTQTVEKAYHWRMSRTSERGIPDLEEALGVYSPLSAESLKLETLDPDDYVFEDHLQVPPQYLIAQADPSTFLGHCVPLIKNARRLDAIRWELVCLANKVMVADRRDPASLEHAERVFRKVLGYINIGLELSAEGDLRKGAGLLERTWMQFLFQAGYQRVMTLKWQAEKLLKEHGGFLDFLLTAAEKDQIGAMVYRFPQLREWVEMDETLKWRDFASVEDILLADHFLKRWVFHVRFSKHALDLTERTMQQYLEDCDFPDNKESMDLVTWVTTALARFLLFKEISCAPLAEAAAKSFLEIIFLPKIFQGDSKVCNEEIIQSFQERLLQIPMAWTGDDRSFLQGLLAECVRNLEQQFAGVNPKGEIQWQYTRGLCVRVRIH